MSSSLLPEARAADLYYRLDRLDRIIELGGEWDRFACDNGGQDLIGNSVLGRRLDEFISGDACRDAVRIQIEAARHLDRPRVAVYRCDAPGMKRFIEMTIRPEARGEVVLEHRLIRVQAFPGTYHFSAGLGHQGVLMMRCNMCNRLRRGYAWVEPEEFFLRASHVSLRVCYGICDRCNKLIERERDLMGNRSAPTSVGGEVTQEPPFHSW